VGEWAFPAPPLGVPTRTRVSVTAGDGHLVAYVPVAGTFRLYLQDDGTLHSEDSYERYVPVRDEAGALAGIADMESIVTAGIMAAANGEADRADRVLAMGNPLGGITIAVGRAAVDLLAGRDAAAEQRVRSLAVETEARRVELEVNAVGYLLLQSEKAQQAREVFTLNTRVFPDAFNTWDSLGEAHMVLGHDEEAIRAYERSLALNPENTNAKTMIARIRERAGTGERR
jgi:predicted Zn-dependent protease